MPENAGVVREVGKEGKLCIACTSLQPSMTPRTLVSTMRMRSASVLSASGLYLYALLPALFILHRCRWGYAPPWSLITSSHTQPHLQGVHCTDRPDILRNNFAVRMGCCKESP